MTPLDDFPHELQHLLIGLVDEGFEILYGEVEGDGGSVGFVAHQEKTEILVTDRTQTWFVTMRSPYRPNVDDCWNLPRRVRGEVWEWLQDYGR